MRSSSLPLFASVSLLTATMDIIISESCKQWQQWQGAVAIEGINSELKCSELLALSSQLRKTRPGDELRPSLVTCVAEADGPSRTVVVCFSDFYKCQDVAKASAQAVPHPPRSGLSGIELGAT